MLPDMTSVAPAVRALTADDVEAIVDLATLCDIAETGEIDHEAVDWIRGARADRYRAYGLDGDGGLAAYAFLECEQGHTGLTADIRVRPGLDHAIADALLEKLRAAAAEFDAAKPVHLFVNSGAGLQQRWLQRHGGREIRHFWRMAIDLDDTEPDLPPVPTGAVVRRARDDDADLQRIHQVVEAAFAEHFGHSGERGHDDWIEMWRSREGFDLTLWWVAEVDGEPVAVLLGSTLAGTGHIGTLGTLPGARGRGLGTYLLRTAFVEFHRRGLRRVALGVDSENGTGAVRLYESVGMRAVRDWPLYELPPLSIAG